MNLLNRCRDALPLAQVKKNSGLLAKNSARLFAKKNFPLLAKMKLARLASLNPLRVFAYLCEESCRYCGRSVIAGETGTPGVTLCINCNNPFVRNRQSFWKLPIFQSAHDESEAGGTGHCARRNETGRGTSRDESNREETYRDETRGTRYGVIGELPVVTGGTYAGRMQKLIRRLKYDDDRLVVQDIGPLMIRAFDKLLTEVSDLKSAEELLVVPIPLHPSREHKRGYNQAHLLAKYLSTHRQLRIEPKVLRRVKKTKPQFGLNKPDRLSNLQDAFVLGQTDVSGKSIVLIDDVFTSGATLIACARILTAGGARAVAAVAAARAPYDK